MFRQRRGGGGDPVSCASHAQYRTALENAHVCSKERNCIWGPTVSLLLGIAPFLSLKATGFQVFIVFQEKDMYFLHFQDRNENLGTPLQDPAP